LNQRLVLDAIAIFQIPRLKNLKEEVKARYVLQHHRRSIVTQYRFN
jgi:hypothetical protein